MKLLSVLFLMLSLIASPKAKALEVGILGGLNYANPSVTSNLGTITVTPKGNLIAGAYVQKSFNALLDAEIGLMYIKKKADLTILGNTTTNAYNAIQIPLIFRTGFIPGNFFNVGAGAYFETVSGSTPSGSKSNDYGLVGSAQVRLPLAPLMKFIIDARYNFGLSEQSTDTSSGTAKNRAFQVLGGISLGI